MKFVDDYRNKEVSKDIIQKINKEFSYNKIKRKINIMEVCGTHTMSIYKNNIDTLLPKNINLISGPGCPVCVTSKNFIDRAINLYEDDKLIICTFADMLKVPGSHGSLRGVTSKKNNIITIYSPLDCLEICKKNKDKEIVFLGVGFETTAPIIGLTIKKAYENNVNNFSVLCDLKTMPNVMKKILLDKDAEIHGFICPGHVGSVIGNSIFNKLANEYKIPMIMSGFEHTDIIYAIYSLCNMIESKKYICENEYKRIVRNEGNSKCIKELEDVFEIKNEYWRGLGFIENSGLKIRAKYEKYDAMKKFNIKEEYKEDTLSCVCKDIIKGIKRPYECQFFNKQCNPNNPIGPCMVSDEGSCANYLKYKI